SVFVTAPVAHAPGARASAPPTMAPRGAEERKLGFCAAKCRSLALRPFALGIGARLYGIGARAFGIGARVFGIGPVALRFGVGREKRIAAHARPQTKAHGFAGADGAHPTAENARADAVGVR